MKKILVLGRLGYHHEQITKPIINHLEKYFDVDYKEFDSDFFIFDKYKKVLDESKMICDLDLSQYSASLMLDYWNLFVPILSLLKSVQNKNHKFFGLFHGSTDIPYDLATQIPSAESYEKYLFDFYDGVFYPIKYKWVDNDKIIFAPYPIDNIKNISRPLRHADTRILYPHRWSDDKGVEMFIEFIKKLDSNYTVTITNPEPDSPEPTIIKTLKDECSCIIDYKGHITYQELIDIMNDGEWVWSSATSELTGYAMLSAIARGMTPIVLDIPAYESYPVRFKFNNLDEAHNIISQFTYLNDKEWKDMIEWQEGGVQKMVDTILSKL